VLLVAGQVDVVDEQPVQVKLVGPLLQVATRLTLPPTNGVVVLAASVHKGGAILGGCTVSATVFVFAHED